MPLVLVEAVVQKGAQHASALRDAETDRAVERAVRDAELGCAFVLESAHGVADRCEPEACERRTLRFVDDLVDSIRLEPVVEINVGGIGDRAAARRRAGELPALARNRLAWIERPIAHGQRIRRARGVRRGVRDMAAVAERLIETALAHHEVAAYPPGERRAAVRRRRRIDAQQIRAAERRIELPADPENAVALIEQKSVAELGRGSRRRGSPRWRVRSSAGCPCRRDSRLRRAARRCRVRCSSV